jgi:ribonuclease VapC
VPADDGGAWVIDASALLALLQGETGADVAAELIAAGAVMSAVNLSEVMAKLADEGQVAAETQIAIDAAVDREIRIEPFTERDAADAADLRPGSRAQGLSSGDRACLALAARIGAPAVTTDRSWAELPELGVVVKLIR